MTRRLCFPVVPALIVSGLLALYCTAHAAALPNAPMTIAVCDDDNEWPPVSYYVRKNGVRTEALTGYAIDILDEIFARRQIKYSIHLIPWPRCKAVAALGQQYQMVINFSYNPERLKNFYYSRAFYTTTAYYYYSRKNNPAGLSITKPADMKKYRICGVQGFNYSGYGLAPGDVDQGAKDFTALINKIKLGRCVLFVEKDEVMMAYAKIGKPFLDDAELAKAAIPGMRLQRFYFGISRRFARAAELHELIDDELLVMEENGRLDELWKKAAALKAPP